MIFFSEFHPIYIMMNQINGSFTNKTNQPTKQKPTHTYREQISGYQRGWQLGVGEMGEGAQLYGDSGN